MRSLFSTSLIPLLTLTGAALLVAGCGKGAGKIPGLDHFNAQVLEKNLSVSFVSSTLQTDIGLSLPIPGLDGATLGLGPDLQSDGTLFQFTIPLASLLKGTQSLPLSGLPDGRPLPGIIRGKLPRWDIMARDTRVSLYLSVDAFGLFIPLTFLDQAGATLPFMVNVPIRDDRGNTLGKAFALPAASSGKGSGIFVLIPAPGSSARAQETNPH